MQNVIFKGYDNPVILEFSFSGEISSLADFTEITLQVGDEVYSTTLDPQHISVIGNTLTLSIGEVTDLASGRAYVPTIIGYSATYDDGYVLNSRAINKLPAAISVADA